MLFCINEFPGGPDATVLWTVYVLEAVGSPPLIYTITKLNVIFELISFSKLLGEAFRRFPTKGQPIFKLLANHLKMQLKIK